jgi:hypothetical protein
MPLCGPLPQARLAPRVLGHDVQHTSIRAVLWVHHLRDQRERDGQGRGYVSNEATSLPRQMVSSHSAGGASWHPVPAVVDLSTPIYHHL